ncbi:hypothetical protein [Luethyella okanaganae]|uniref:Uncharacterized protein n=1 Tax=Luethyella okanaganae TaxID=69372 RepID=A0ABW1VG31_9MICO
MRVGHRDLRQLAGELTHEVIGPALDERDLGGCDAQGEYAGFGDPRDLDENVYPLVPVLFFRGGRGADRSDQHEGANAEAVTRDMFLCSFRFSLLWI